MRRRKNSKRLQDEYWKNQMAELMASQKMSTAMTEEAAESPLVKHIYDSIRHDMIMAGDDVARLDGVLFGHIVLAYVSGKMALLHDMGLSGLDLEHKDMPASEPRLFDF